MVGAVGCVPIAWLNATQRWQEVGYEQRNLG